MNVSLTMTLAKRNRVPPLLSGSALALLLHGLVLLWLLTAHWTTPPHLPKQMLTIIELQPRPDAPAVAQLPTPPAAPPKRPRAPRPPRTFSPAPLQQPSEHLASSVQLPDQAQPPPVSPSSAATVSSPAPAPPIQASSGEVTRIPTAYLREVSIVTARYHIYPLSARDKHQQGEPVIHLHLRRDGTVLDATLEKSSGYAVLDESARQEFFRIGKFAYLPDEYAPGRPDFWIDQPVTFRKQ